MGESGIREEAGRRELRRDVRAQAEQPETRTDTERARLLGQRAVEVAAAGDRKMQRGMPLRQPRKCVDGHAMAFTGYRLPIATSRRSSGPSDNSSRTAFRGAPAN